MTTELQGEDVSLWVATTPQTQYKALSMDDTLFDAVVVGGGITGIVTAYRLQESGLNVALVERGRIVEWTTGGTTAKLSSQHYLVYDHLIKRHGVDVARAFASANQRGIDDVEDLSRELAIDCDFSRRDAYVFTEQPEKVAAMKAEVEAALSLGLPASFEDKIDLPYDIAGAVRFADQAQFHPRKFLLPLAEKFVALGGVIYEQTNATDIKPGSPNIVVTDKGELRGHHVVQASGEPFWHSEIFAGRMWIKMSYGLAVELNDPAAYPSSMYITTDTPMRTIRSADYDAGQLLIFGGESHEYDDETFDADRHYRNLIDDVRRLYDVKRIAYRWLAGDFMPYDRIPFIGPDPEYPDIYTITGYRAWGLAWAMSAARGITSYIEGRPEPWTRYFSLDRLATPLRESDKVHGF